ncbi:MAG TPA: FtsX-like permease family protein [Saprospiraceae bacterium]|nr:FtsX-like permease family protein [Saprospiraceae bacterium]
MLFIIAWRNLWRHRTRSLVIIASVALGVWAGAFIVSLYYGMGNERVRIAIEQEVSHIQVHHPKFREDFDVAFHFDLDSLDAVLRHTPGMKAYSLRTTVQGMLANAAGSNGVQINGVEPAAENATRGLAAFVIDGAYLDAGKKNQVLVGKKLADKMKLTPGNKIVLTFQDKEQGITSGAFRIAGIYETANAPLDERNVYVRRNDLNDLLGTPGCGTEAAVLLTGEGEMPAALAMLQQSLPELQVEDWRAISPETALVMSALDVTSLIIISIILLALAFGIINTMLMAVLERTREIGMLMAIGMTKIRLFGMVVLETLLLTLAGCPIGFGLAWLVNAWLSKTGIDLSDIAGNVMKGFGYGAVIYPDLPDDKVWQILQIVFVTALVASIFPAWKALRLKPAEAIRR